MSGKTYTVIFISSWLVHKRSSDIYISNKQQQTTRKKMFRNCICIKKERRDSQNSSTSSCRSSEIERNAAAISNLDDDRDNRSFMKFLSSSLCFRIVRTPRRGMSMTKVERGECLLNPTYHFNHNRACMNKQDVRQTSIPPSHIAHSL